MSTPVKGQATAATSYTTPTKRVAIINAEAGPSRARPQGASPAYSSRRHSLYGIEDRIIIDPGSRCWKVGFSGEYDPRSVFNATSEDDDAAEAWYLDLARVEKLHGDRVEARRIVNGRIRRKLQDTYIKHLMTDPKARKVIIIENTFLPTFVKDELAKVLFEHLKAPSIAFTPASVLSLAATGRVTGLVVDIGWLETTVTPVSHSRPLYHFARATPAAARRLHHRLKDLLRHGATYYPPPASLSSLARAPIRPVPEDVLTTSLVEKVMLHCCFTSNHLAMPCTPPGAEHDATADDYQSALQTYLAERYKADADATDVRMRVKPSAGDTQNMGPATLIIPGWLRERAAEVLFGDDEDEVESVPNAILHCLATLPIDLRPIMVSSVLVTGYTASLPGIIPRIRREIQRILSASKFGGSDQNNRAAPTAPLHSSAQRSVETKQWRRRHDQPYADMAQLAQKLAILNDPAPHDTAGEDGGLHGGAQAGKAPRWRSGLMSWIGGSLAGSLKTGGPEILREDYDTLSATRIAKGESYLQALETEATVLEDLAAYSNRASGVPASDATTTVPPPMVHSSPVPLSTRSGNAEVGVAIDDLLPGMALRGMERKRGWRSEVAIADWTRVIKT